MLDNAYAQPSNYSEPGKLPPPNAGVPRPRGVGQSRPSADQKNCPDCHGRGSILLLIRSVPCARCKGKGTKSDEATERPSDKGKDAAEPAKQSNPWARSWCGQAPSGTTTAPSFNAAQAPSTGLGSPSIIETTYYDANGRIIASLRRFFEANSVLVTSDLDASFISPDVATIETKHFDAHGRVTFTQRRDVNDLLTRYVYEPYGPAKPSYRDATNTEHFYYSPDENPPDNGKAAA